MAQKKNPFKGYKCIEVNTYDPSHMKKEEKIDGKRAKRTFYYCNNCENCEALCIGQCFQKNMPVGRKCPYGGYERKESETGTSQEIGRFLYKSLKRHRSHSQEELFPVKELCRIGDYIYLPLNYLENYTDSIAKRLNILEGHLIHKKDFTVENIAELIAYRPLSLSGGVIENYVKEDIPFFVAQLKVFSPDIFAAELKLFPNLEEIIENLDFRDKEAYLFTLKSGTVILNNIRYNWNGEYLRTEAKNLIPSLKHDEELRVYPHDDTIVMVDDNNTVEIGETVFV